MRLADGIQVFDQYTESGITFLSSAGIFLPTPEPLEG